MLDTVHRDTPQASFKCRIKLLVCKTVSNIIDKLMRGCLQLIISKHQPDLASARAIQISPSCCFVSHTREVFRHMLACNKGWENHVSETLTSISLELYFWMAVLGIFIFRNINMQDWVINITCGCLRTACWYQELSRYSQSQQSTTKRYQVQNACSSFDVWHNQNISENHLHCVFLGVLTEKFTHR